MKTAFMHAEGIPDMTANQREIMSDEQNGHVSLGLQFQKQLRSQEARRLMLNQNMDAGQAASVVGYESSSQFSREYNRQFGAPPHRDVRRMRSR